MAGLALAHVLDYLIVESGGASRPEPLTATGHGWYHVAALGAVAGVLAVIGSFRCGLHQRFPASRRPVRAVPLLSDVRRVAVLQMALFGAIEIAERLAADQPMTGLLQSRLLLVGLTLQAVAACVVATVLRAAEQAAARLSTKSALSTCAPSQRLFEMLSSDPSLAARKRPDCRGPPLCVVRFAT